MLARLRWPLPALLAWGLSWGLFLGLQGAGLSGVVAIGLAGLASVAFSLWGNYWWRRGLIGLGFPLSVALTGAASLPAWAWLVPLAVLLLIYPVNAWRDAPLFPTPAHALRELAGFASLPDGALVLDAGCGLGAGLKALREAYPRATLHGLEWSWPLRAACALRCPWARVRQGDIWQADWRPYAMVYLFQRPESMDRAMRKACAEMAPGSWLVSLEFRVPGHSETASFTAPGGRPVWLYRMHSPMQHKTGMPQKP
jgi:hypothetical protein